MDGRKWSRFINDSVIINLKERDDRRELLDWRMNRIDMGNGETLKDYVRYMEAVDTTMLDQFPEGIVSYDYSFDYHYFVDSRPPLRDLYGQGHWVDSTPTERAIAFSHYTILRDIVENKTPVTLVMEDDILFRHEFLLKMEHFMENELPHNFDFAYLSYDTTDSLHAEKITPWLYEVHLGFWWMSGYLITYEGAKKLLERLPIIGPVDVWINHQFKDLNVYAISEPVIMQSFETSSSNDWSFNNKFDRD